MVIYEVNLAVAQSVAEKFAFWLREHVAEMLTIKGFRSARILQPEAGVSQDFPARLERELLWVVHYEVLNSECLHEYFANHAEKMRAQGAEKFPGALRSARRVLDLKFSLPEK
jgi:hypothetical protein